ncbi:MAG: hypothetical protein KME30_29355 [Iphinoe sp. HA4291-MV1]|jgi:WD40 repeat protein|nr:hypothetical protein [Iphinoe sp. HA4291-MV1]
MDDKISKWLDKLSADRREYILKKGISTFIHDGYFEKVYDFLTNFTFISEKLNTYACQALLEDYERSSRLENDPQYAASAKTLNTIHMALQRSSPVLTENPQNLPSRLWGHLASEQDPGIQKLLQQAIDHKAESDNPYWLRPLEGNLSTPGTSLQTTLTGHSGSVTSLAVTSDSSTLITGSNRQIKIWNLATFTSDTINFSSADYHSLMSLVRKYDFLLFDSYSAEMAHPRYVQALALAANDSILVSGSSDGVLQVWDLNTRKLLRVQEFIRARFAAFNYDELREYICSSKIAGQRLDPYNAIISLASIPGTDCVAVGCEDGDVHLYDFVTGKLVTFRSAHPDAVTRVIIDKDGMLITGSQEVIRIWDLSKGQVTSFESNPSPFIPGFGCNWDFRMIPVRQALFTRRDRTVFICDLVSRRCLFELDHSHTVRAVAVTPDGQKIIVGESFGDVVVWDISEIDALQAAVQPTQPENGFLSRLRNFFSRPPSLIELPAHHSKKLATLEGHGGYPIASLAVTPDGKYAISGADEVKLWRLDRLSQASESLAQHQQTVLRVAVSPDGKRLVSSEGKHIKIWNLTTRKVLYSISKDNYAEQEEFGCLLVTHDNQRLIVGNLEVIDFYNLETGKEEDSVFVQGCLVNTLAISADGKRLLSGGDCQVGRGTGATLRLWDIGGLKAKHIEACSPYVDADGKAISGVAITPDGKRALYIALGEKMITLWSLKTKQVINTFPNSLFMLTVDPTSQISVAAAKTCDLCYSPFVLIPNTNRLIATSPLFFTIIDLDTGHKIAELPPRKTLFGQIRRHHSQFVKDIAVAPNGKWFVSVSLDGTMKVWELATGDLLTTFRCESNFFTCCTVASDNYTIIAGDFSGQIHFFRLERGENLQHIETNSESKETNYDSYTNNNKTTKIYTINLKGFPSGFAYLKIQFKGKGNVDINLDLKDNHYYNRKWIYNENKIHKPDIILIPLPPHFWESEDLVGNITIKSNDKEVSFLLTTNIKISCPFNIHQITEYKELISSINKKSNLYKVLELQKCFLGNDHPDVLITLDDLKQRCEKIGSYAEAEFFQNEIYDIQQRRKKIELGDESCGINLFLTKDEMGLETFN